MSDPYQGMGRVERFDAINGADAITVSPGWLLYSNGAMRENSGYGVLAPPPTKPVECCKLKLQYRETVYRLAAEAFTDAKHRLRRIAEFNRENDYGPPDQSEMKKLLDLHTKAKEAKAALGKARRELDKLQPPELRSTRRGRATFEDSIARFEKTLGDLKI